MNIRVSAIAANLDGKVNVLGATQLYITPMQERNEINEPNVKRILGIYHKGKLQKEIIKGIIKEDGLIGMVNWA